MKTDAFSMAAAIIMVFPMLYFAIVTPNFFFFKFHDLTVTRVLRGLFDVYFLSVMVCCSVGMIAFAAAGRTYIAFAVAFIAALAFAARRWFLRELDAQIRARDAGDVASLGRLRRLQVGGMLYNAVHLVAVLGGIPFVLA